MDSMSEPGHGGCPDTATLTEADVRSNPPAGAHIACHRFNVYSDPPGAHIYAANNYWGKTGLDTPVTGYWWCAVTWNEQKREWTWARDSVLATASVLQITFTAKRVNCSDATQVIELHGQDFQVRSGTPEELTASGLLGHCPSEEPAYTSDVMLVLQSGDII